MSVGFVFGVNVSGILWASFAAWSANSFPVMPAWPGIHMSFILGDSCAFFMYSQCGVNKFGGVGG